MFFQALNRITISIIPKTNLNIYNHAYFHSFRSKENQDWYRIKKFRQFWHLLLDFESFNYSLKAIIY